MGVANLSLSQNKVVFETSSSALLGAKAKFSPAKETKCLWKRFMKCADPNSCYQ